MLYFFIFFFFLLSKSSDQSENAANSSNYRPRDIQLYNSIVLDHQAISQAMQDAHYSEPEFWYYHQDIYTQIIQDATQRATVPCDDDEYNSDESNYSYDKSYVNLDLMYKIIENEISIKKKQLLPRSNPITLNGGQSLRITPCGHIFHITCIRENLKVSKNCPLCKTKFSKKSLKYIHPSKVRNNEICCICQEQLKKKQTQEKRKNNFATSDSKKLKK